MKGKWILDLAARTLDGSVSIWDAISFALARLRPKPLEIHLAGVSFPSAGHTTWSVIADIFFGRVYSPPGFEIQPDWTVVDIGAHRGVFSAFAITSGAAKVVAFEPHPSNFKSLRQLAARQGWQHVQVHEMALAAESGSAYLQVSGTSSLGSTVNVSAGDPHTIKVAAMSLEDALADLPRVDLLKMDCEGAEFEILQAAPRHVLERVERLVLEYHAAPGSADLIFLIDRIRGIYNRVHVAPRAGYALGYLYARNQ